MISEIKTFVKYLLFWVIDGLVDSAKKDHKNRLLLIRMDAIGDYVLFRNFIEALVEDEKFRNHKVTLLGNAAWESIAESLDNELLESFIWVNKRKFERNPVYRFRMLREICSKAYDVVINPVYSREFFSQDLVVAKVTSDHKIGSRGNFSNYFEWQKNIASRNYTKLISNSSRNLFEFDRNKEFFEKLLNRRISLKKPTIIPHKSWQAISLPENYAVLFIGASRRFKKWPVSKYAEVAEHLQEKLRLAIVVCGGPDDEAEAQNFDKYYKGAFIDLVGKTTLLELMGVLSKANLLISNETSAPHFAVALDVPNIFVISNGNHYGRFSPYPTDVTEDYHAVFPPELTNQLEGFDIDNSPKGFESKLVVSDIKTESVIEEIEKRYKKPAV